MGAKFSKRASTPPPVVIGKPVGEPKPKKADEPTSADKPTKTGETGAAGTQQLDLVFTMDCTGSMGSYIQAAKRNIEAIVARLVQSEGYDLRFALVAYRDHPPQDQTYVTKSFPFTDDLAQMQRDLATLSAQGGGDGPEAVAAGLNATLHSDWRPNATKVCILIADAPPHGLGERGDGFPNGAPDGVDPLEVLENMSMRGICIYSVGCEPALSGYKHAKAFMVAAAQKTNGQAVSLGSAAALADVIMGGAIEEMDLEALATEVVEEAQQLRARQPSMDEEACKAAAWESLQARGHVTRHVKGKKLKSKSAALVFNAASLAEARDGLKSVAPPPAVRAAKGRGRRCAPTAASLDGDLLSSIGSSRGGAAEHFDMEFVSDGSSPHYRCSLRRELSGSDGEADASESDDDDVRSDAGSDAVAEKGGVRLETRALSFTQMSRIWSKQKKMGKI